MQTSQDLGLEAFYINLEQIDPWERHLLEERVSAMPSTVCKVFWDVDAPATLERLSANEYDGFHRALPRFDLVLTYGGGERVTPDTSDLQLVLTNFL